MPDNQIRFVSMNCRGLGDSRKRRDVFHFLRDKKYSICLLQDTHFQKSMEGMIKNEWGFEIFFASFSSNSRGVAVLFNNNFEFKINNVYKDINGNWMIIKIFMYETNFLIINVYGPNTDNPAFYLDLENRIKELEYDHVIFSGDWNLVLDYDMDCLNYKKKNNTNAQAQVKKTIENLDLVDIWRASFPDLKRYTWRRTSPLQQSRLDYFIVSETLVDLVSEVDIKPGYRTDHSIITLTLEFDKECKTKSFWKFNSSLLSDQKYLKEINNEIEEVKSEYSATPYDRQQLLRLPCSEIQLTISDQTFLEVLLMRIRMKTMTYASHKKRKYTEKEKKLEVSIANLQNKTDSNKDEQLQLEKDKRELEKIRDYRMKGVLLRSRARWVEDGEKVSKYFCALEKRNYVNKFIKKLISNGNLITNREDIIGEMQHFYEKLYTKKEVEPCVIDNLVKNIPKLNADESDILEGEIQLNEASLALKNMKNNKSPGSDGFTSEFFKVFWKQLGPFIVRSLNEGFRKGELSNTQKEGIIICIPKPDKPKELLSNWRPITLLNVIYKIGSACIANRIKSVLEELINEDQTGFVKNRFIGDNLRLIYDIINFLTETNSPGLLICCDFEKAFDTLDWNFLMITLQAFGFGSDICRWVETLYKHGKSCISVNGQISSWFSISRGCRQGDPISPYLFILCAEILGQMIRENNNIRGIEINRTEHKLSQFADDTEIFLKGDSKSFEETIITINKFGNFSGLLLNTSKTSAIWLGKKRNSPIRYLEHLNIDWNPNKFKILGIWFTNDLKDIININFDIKFREVKILYNIWIKRQITPVGRVSILKSLILSKLTYLWILLPNPPNSILCDIQKSIFEFVWGFKRNRINKKVSTKNIAEGGIGIPDIKNYIMALKLTWIKRILTSTHKWKTILSKVSPLINNLMVLGSNIPTDKMNQFWKDVFSAYEVFGLCIKLKKSEEVLAEPIFYNDKFTVGNKIMMNDDWFKKNIKQVCDLVTLNGTFLSYNEFIEKYSVNSNYLEYYSCVGAIRAYLRLSKILIEDNVALSNHTSILTLLSVSKGSKRFYDILSSNDCMPKFCKKWEDKLNCNINWKSTLNFIATTKEVKLKWFQIRISHRIIATNVILHSMGIAPDDKCSFCERDKENIQHLFYYCNYVKEFWNNLKTILIECGLCNEQYVFSKSLLILGFDPNNLLSNIFLYVILVARYYIYKCKFDKVLPYVNIFKIYLKGKYNVEKHNASLRGELESFCHCWEPWKLFLGDI